MTGTGQVERALARGGADIEVVTGADPGYDEARRVWNGCVDRRPAAVVRCRSAAAVAHTVRTAVAHGLPLAIRGGGHSLPGFSTCDGGIVADLSPMRHVEVDAAARIGRADGGCRWGDYDAATAAHGLASTGGVISSTGVAGLTLGGGIGWLMNQHGLACDNLIGAEVVTADGSVVDTADPRHADLLWALRGGGGNFGVVTRFDFRLSPMGLVVGGLMFYPMARAAEIVRGYRDLARTFSDRFTSMLVFGPAPDEPFMPAELRDALSIAVVGCHTGSAAEAEADLRPLRDLDPAVDLFEPMPYPAMQRLFDAEFPHGGRYYFKGGFLPALPDGALDALRAFMDDRPSAACEFDLHHMGGAVHRVDETGTAFPGRAASYTYNIVARWHRPADDDDHRAWARRFAAALEPFGQARGFTSFLSDEADAWAVEAAYGASRYKRLVALKRRYDPGNVFQMNQNVRP